MSGERALSAAHVITFRKTASSVLNEFHSKQCNDNAEEEKMSIIKTSAKLIKTYIMCIDSSKSEYPSPADLDKEENIAFLPDSLRLFLRALFSENDCLVKVASVGQAIMRATRPRPIIAPLQMSLGIQMHHHFGSILLLDTLNSLGFASSYTEVQKFELNAAASQERNTLSPGNANSFTSMQTISTTTFEHWMVMGRSKIRVQCWIGTDPLDPCEWGWKLVNEEKPVPIKCLKGAASSSLLNITRSIMEVNDSSSVDLEISQSTTIGLSCQEGNNDDRYCVTCHGDCCIKCITSSHKDHNILLGSHSIVQSIKRFPTDMCTSHEDEKLSMYCVTCKTPCCHTCIDENHDGHPMSTIKSIAKQADSLHAKLVDVLPETKSRCIKMREDHDDYVKSVNIATTAIKSHFERLRSKIDEMEIKMIQPLIAECEEVNSMQTDIGQPLLETECLVELYNAANEEDNHFKKVIFFSNCPPLESLDSQHVSLPEPVAFKQVPLDFLNTEKIAGCVVRSSGQSFHNRKSSSTCKEPQIYDVLKFTSIDTSLEGKVFHSTDGESWIISKGDNTNLGYRDVLGSNISILDKTFNYQEVFKTIEYEVSDASLVPPSDLIYTDPYHSKVWQINKSGSNRLVFDTYPLTPNGICATRDKILVLGLEDFGIDESTFMIRMYSLNSLRFLDEIEKDELGKPLFSSITRILENSLDDLIVEESGQLLCVSRQGNVKWKLEKKFTHYCFDEYNNIFAAFEDDIKVLNSSGEYIETLLTKKYFLKHPTSLSIDNDGVLWIGQGSNTKLVKYRNKRKKNENPTGSEMD
ncbi:hypothetical protein FSP39_010552 [Pinctada imbricata]|uniref:B box-type domain-containing protein n=1 Tax=Pinctada imbricata TaxID=66713 RepID=A0AA89C9V1_PINIB|nr:hypothetical protein FSP39_010552 [Pinctada imbricata]